MTQRPVRRLTEFREIWNRKAILREVYAGWYRDVVGDLKAGKGKALEVGSGIGNLQQFHPGIISSDIERAEWLDLCLDAQFLPFGDETLQNIVAIDVLHHLAAPLRFIEEAERTLGRGGRLILLEPYPSLLSLPIYRLFHREPFLMNVDYFQNDDPGFKEHLTVNQAAAYLLFYKQKKAFSKAFGRRFLVIKRKRMSGILYPLSGGFERNALLPVFLLPLARRLERFMTPFLFLSAFRCYIVLEKS